MPITLRFQSVAKLSGLLALVPLGVVLSVAGSSALAAGDLPIDPEPGSAPPLLAQAGMPETVLFFETDSMSVRIFRRGRNLFMNLYDKATDSVEVNATPAEIVPGTRDMTVYKNSQGEADRFARITIQGDSELEIVAPDGTVVLKEAGYHTVVGIPSGETDFQGNNFAPGTSAVVLSARYANLRSQPRLDSDTLASAPRRAIVDVVDRVGSLEDGYIWYQVLYEGQRGWVRGDLLQPV